MKTLLTFLLLASVSCYGKKVYTLSKNDFIYQFRDTTNLLQVHCINEKGLKVWLHTTAQTILVAKMQESREKKLILYKVTLKGDAIEAIEYNVWIPSKKIISINIDSVHSFEIEKNGFQEYERPYFSLDSARALLKFKNDSLANAYTGGEEFVIYMKEKNNPAADTIAIIENACYHLKFKDGNDAEFGVVYKITKDSISVSNRFNEAIAKRDKKEYRIYNYAISDLAELSVFRFKGQKFRTLKFTDYDILVSTVPKADHGCPCWFSLVRYNGEVYFYRYWRTENGFAGISEQNGRPIWLER
ncbi:hypothetical protein [Pollutibacter soli]|uniref:hypothetical protein n=1 Tax=Pollutibacter soli TaxID=3034157 RepID=UPI00301331BF